MLVPVFSLKLNHKINARAVTIGNYNGKHPSLTCATTGGKVFVHHPHSRKEFSSFPSSVGSGGDISLLNINQQVASLCAGKLDPDVDDILLVGTQNNLLAYNVENNTDVFFNETPDGANAIVLGRLGTFSSPLALVGGNCSLQGFDVGGNDKFWTVTGDNVCSLALVDFDRDGKNELLVGSEDFDIRVFREDEIIAEMSETEAVTCLCSMLDGHFGYALSNGTVGVYNKSARQWRIKSKNQPVAIRGFDLNGDGVMELITGWSNGRIDVRNDHTGEVIFKDTFSSSVAGIVQGEYSQTGKDQLICCSLDGEVRGYDPILTGSGERMMDTNPEQEAIRDLSQKKQKLLMELKTYKGNSQAPVKDSAHEDFEKITQALIPANTRLQTSLSVKSEENGKPAHVELSIQTSNDTIIRAVLIFAEGIFKGESHVVHPNKGDLSSSLEIPIIPPKDSHVDLHIKIFVGYKESLQFHVYELSQQLPKFSMYVVCSNSLPSPKGFVTFPISDRVQRNFLIKDEIEAKSSLQISFNSLRGKGIVRINMDAGGQVVIRTDSMEIAGDLVQSLAAYINLEDLQVTADFPEELNYVRQILEQVEAYNTVRQKLTAEIADHSNLIRNMVVRAEDARLMGDMKAMKRGYIELYGLNLDLINGYKIRSVNHQELLSCLKDVNRIIQKAGQLRVGKYKTEVITACRAALKNNNTSALIKIIKTGS